MGRERSDSDEEGNARERGRERRIADRQFSLRVISPVARIRRESDRSARFVKVTSRLERSLVSIIGGQRSSAPLPRPPAALAPKRPAGSLNKRKRVSRRADCSYRLISSARIFMRISIPGFSGLMLRDWELHGILLRNSGVEHFAAAGGGFRGKLDSLVFVGF